MSLLSLKDLTLSFGGLPLLNGVDLQVEPGERICLIGRNGEGKSSLMKIISNELAPDSGEMIRQKGLTVTRLSQEVPASLEGTVFDVVAGGLDSLFGLLTSYHEASRKISTDHSEAALAALEEAQHALEVADGWQAHQQVEVVLSKLELPPDTPFADLSGGLKRRVLLGRALVGKPDLLLLDEPTNHLDISAIAWLEEFLLGFGGTLLFVTHDRFLLQKLATRIVELDRGKLSSWPGDYQNYLRRREETLAAEASQAHKFDKKLAEEEAWIRQGIKARRTRNEGRVRALVDLRKKRSERRQQQGSVKLSLQKGELSGKLVAVAEEISFSYDDKVIVDNLTTTIMRGDRIGIIGPNGVGKTTLIKLLLGELPPESGSVKQGTNLQACYFDQHREQLDPEKSVADNVADGNDKVTINGQPKHIIGYLKDFLFAPDRARSPVSILSGGEKNRLLLAKLFTKPFNVLVLDEPTNDLDVETLELLEDLLLKYSGTLLLVSHDRTFLNNVVTSTLVFEGKGKVTEYAGGYDDWLSQRQPDQPVAKPAPTKAKPSRPPAAAPQKLTYKEERELESLPQTIESLEEEQETLCTQMADPSFYQQEGELVAKSKDRLSLVEKELESAYGRWEELEEKQEQFAAAKGN